MKTNSTRKSAVKTERAFLVEVNGVFLHEGWGYPTNWVFRKKYMAQEVIDTELRPFDMHEGAKIIPCTITFTKPKKV